jgi:NADPH:quinone reductase-like Zn-dependent oxidoreductase
VFRRSGGAFPNHLVLSSERIGIVDPKSVLIKVHAVSLNYRDINILRGTNPWAVKLGGIPVSDAAAEVIAIGESVTRFKVPYTAMIYHISQCS